MSMSGEDSTLEISAPVNLRDTGLELLGSAPWGTHLCQFYQTTRDLMEILVPYFEAGLKNNEFCMWVTSPPLTVEEATLALAKEVPGLQHFQENGQILVISYTDWYLKDGRFDEDQVMSGWISMLDHALERGFDGLRTAGNSFQVKDTGWHEFNRYEAAVNSLIATNPMIAICSYSLDKCSSAEIVDVVSTHQFALVKREDKWEMIESSEQRRTREALEIEQSAKQAYLDLAGAIMVAVDTQGTITMINRRGSEILGLPAEEIVGMDWFDNFFPESGREKLRLGFEQIIAGFFTPGEYYEIPITNHLGEERIIAWHYALLRDGDGGVTGMLGSGNDFTELKRTEKNLRRTMQFNQALNTINMTINSTLDMEQSIWRVVGESAQVMGADAVAMAFREGARVWRVRYTYGYSPQAAGIEFRSEESVVAQRILAENEPVVINDTAEEPGEDVLLKSNVNRSFIAVPLFRQSQVSGLVTFEYRTSQMNFDEAQIDFAKKLAASLTLSIENARLYRYEQDSRADIQSYATRLSLLHKIGLSLGQETDRDRLLESILSSAAEMTSAGVGIILLVSQGKTEVVSLYYAPWYKSRCTITKDAFCTNPGLERLMSGTSRNVMRIPGFTNADAQSHMPTGHLHIRGLLIGKLTDARRRTLGYFLLSDKAGDTDFNPEDEEIISLLASQSSVALLSAENFEREHSVAVALQSSLLPLVPNHEKVEVGLEYRSASKIGRIGGDFYDFIDLGNDSIAVAVGDVCGKGLDAAKYTAMVKYTLSAHLEEGMSPGKCLTRLNSLISKNLEPEKFLTLGLAVLNLAENKLHYSVAGHPPPVVSHKGQAFELKTSETLPLGVLREYYFTSHESPISEDMTFLMYTDGITEARSLGGELFGHKRLIKEFNNICSLPAQEIAGKLVDGVMDFSGRHLNDDVAVLVVRPSAREK